MTGEEALRDALAKVEPAIPSAAALTIPERIERAEACADVISTAADALFAGQKKRSEKDDGPRRADVAAAVTEGLAILALRPGGTSFGGLHWHHDAHDDCPGSGELALQGLDRRESKGAYFTPRFLAEDITHGALEALAYRPGPLQTGDVSQWRLVSSPEILALKTGDIACGSGVFLVAAVRYLAGRLAEAWQYEADGTVAPVQPHRASRDAIGMPPLPDHGPLVMAALRMSLRCVYGIDIDQTAAELCRLSLALLVPTVPAPVHLNVVWGDSLLGIAHVDEVVKMRLKPKPEDPDVLPRESVEEPLRQLALWREAQP